MILYYNVLLGKGVGIRKMKNVIHRFQVTFLTLRTSR